MRQFGPREDGLWPCTYNMDLTPCDPKDAMRSDDPDRFILDTPMRGLGGQGELFWLRTMFCIFDPIACGGGGPDGIPEDHEPRLWATVLFTADKQIVGVMASYVEIEDALVGHLTCKGYLVAQGYSWAAGEPSTLV